jgi:hypothetical protein
VRIVAFATPPDKPTAPQTQGVAQNSLQCAPRCMICCTALARMKCAARVSVSVSAQEAFSSGVRNPGNMAISQSTDSSRGLPSLQRIMELLRDE